MWLYLDDSTGDIGEHLQKWLMSACPLMRVDNCASDREASLLLPDLLPIRHMQIKEQKEA